MCDCNFKENKETWFAVGPSWYENLSPENFDYFCVFNSLQDTHDYIKNVANMDYEAGEIVKIYKLEVSVHETLEVVEERSLKRD